MKKREYIATVASFANPWNGTTEELHMGVVLESTEKGCKLVYKTREHFNTEDAARNHAQKIIDSANIHGVTA